VKEKADDVMDKNLWTEQYISKENVEVEGTPLGPVLVKNGEDYFLNGVQ